MFQLNRLRPENAFQLVEITREVEEFLTTEDEDHWSQDELQGWLANDDDCCLGAFIGGRLVGFCLSHFHKEANKVHIENVFVLPDVRRSGIGTALVEGVVLSYISRAQKRIRFVGLVRSDNTHAQNFFENKVFKRGEMMLWYQRDVGLEESPFN